MMTDTPRERIELPGGYYWQQYITNQDGSKRFELNCPDGGIFHADTATEEFARAFAQALTPAPAGMVEIEAAVDNYAEKLSSATSARHRVGRKVRDEAERQEIEARTALLRLIARYRSAPGTPAPTYLPGEWTYVGNVDQMQQFFLARLPYMREAAKEHGYALGLHGSMRRDLDLIAMHWRDDPSSIDELAKAIQQAACGFDCPTYKWTEKPAGRRATSMSMCWTEFGGDTIGLGHIDLSVIPPSVVLSAPGTPAIRDDATADTLAYAVWMVGNMDTEDDKASWWKEFVRVWEYAGTRVEAMNARGVKVGEGFAATGLAVPPTPATWTPAIRDDGLEKLRALSEKATQGDWDKDSFETEDGSGKYHAAKLINSHGKTIADTSNGDLQSVQTEGDEGGSVSWDEQGHADLGFVAVAVNYIRSRLAAVPPTPTTDVASHPCKVEGAGADEATDAVTHRLAFVDAASAALQQWVKGDVAYDAARAVFEAVCGMLKPVAQEPSR